MTKLQQTCFNSSKTESESVATKRTILRTATRNDTNRVYCFKQLSSVMKPAIIATDGDSSPREQTEIMERAENARERSRNKQRERRKRDAFPCSTSFPFLLLFALSQCPLSLPFPHLPSSLFYILQDARFCVSKDL